MDEFQGEKKVVAADGEYPSPEYVLWLEQQVLAQNDTIRTLRKSLAAYGRAFLAHAQRETRRVIDEMDSVGGYADDEYDRDR